MFAGVNLLELIVYNLGTGVYTPGTWRPFLNAQGNGKMSAGIIGGSGVASSQGIACRTRLS